MDNEAPKVNRGGRPAKTGPKMSDYKVYTLMPDEATYNLVKEVAEKQGLNISAWARMVLMKEARSQAAAMGIEA